MAEQETDAAAVDAGGFSRRSMLAGAAGLTGALAAVNAGWRTPSFAADEASDRAATTTPTHVIDLTYSGESGGMFLKSVSGGAAVGEVITEKIGGDGIARKHIAGVKYEDVSCAIDPHGVKVGSAWFSSFLDRQTDTRSGQINVKDVTTSEISTLKFENALLTEFTIPACDGGSKESGFLHIKFEAETTAYTPTGGHTRKPTTPKQWHASNFRFHIDGLDAAKVNKIDALTIKMAVDETGTREPGKIDYPNLVVHVPEAGGEDFWAWHEDFVIKGSNDERSGRLALRTDDGVTFLAIGFMGLGIFDVSPSPVSTTSKGRSLKVEMYCEAMDATWKF